MQPFSVDEIRERFLAFFESKGHLRLPSFSLAPENDNTLLLINSGMAPLKPYFSGQAIPPRKRVTTCQKCVRTQDIDEVGKDARHMTLFEMLGNFSFGDYFKKEVIPWAWEFITQEMGIPAERLYVTVYEQDDEAFTIWRDTVGLPTARIFKMGKEDNFWELGLGPCGPDSEIHYDRGAACGCGNTQCRFGWIRGDDADNPAHTDTHEIHCANSDTCERYIEIWNLVFTQFNKQEDGSYVLLDAPSIDTGMGLERLAMTIQGTASVYETDTLKRIRHRVYDITETPQHSGSAEADARHERSVMIITDHVRSVVFMAADGILPSNEGRGYVLRRLLRRAVRHGKLLGKNEPFLTPVCQTVIETAQNAYPELAEKQAHIIKILSVEEAKFLETLDNGMHLLRACIDETRRNGSHVLSGSDVFRLYDTYGFPVELMEEILAEEGFTPDMDGFQAAMRQQREKARAARGASNYLGAEETVYDKLDVGLHTDFMGYTQTTLTAVVTALAVEDAIAAQASEGQAVTVFLDKTPFYAESGGQKGDAGFIKTAGGVVQVADCIKVAGGKMAHVGTVTAGTIAVGETAEAAVDVERRLATARNHSATHLLQKALREILGTHVEQAGSEVSSGRLRFDFTHYAAMDAETLARVERCVNAQITAGLPISVQETDMPSARAMGAVMLFGEKYGETVRVVDMGGYSIELCGGTHLQNTMQIGTFKIIGESSVAAGVRRIEALTGENALAYYRLADQRLRTAAAALKAEPERVPERVAALVAELRQARQEIDRLKQKMAGSEAEAILQSGESFGGFTLIAVKRSGLDAAGLRTLCDKLKEKCQSCVLLLCGVTETAEGVGTVQFLAYATDDAVKAGVHAGQLVKAAATRCGGNGGGRPGTAQAGGRDMAGADEAMALALALAKQQLSAARA